MKFFLGFLSAIVVMIIIALIVIYTGWYDISATGKEGGITEWVLETTMENSVRRSADGINIPDNLSDEKKIEEGFHHYSEMCEFCHGAPGKEPIEFAKGLNPKAPDLGHSAKEMKTEELFWVTKHGIKMTGMPAWGITHSDEELWSIVAFLNKLPELSAEDYETFSVHTNSVNENHSNHEH